jgi:type IV pilus assembly protein PilE
MAADKCGSFSIDQTGATRISGQAEGLTAKDCWGL